MFVLEEIPAIELTEPLPCPFCGSDPFIKTEEPSGYYGDSWTFIRCGKCRVSPYVGQSRAMRYWSVLGFGKMVDNHSAEEAKKFSRKAAIHIWNQRAS